MRENTIYFIDLLNPKENSMSFGWLYLNVFDFDIERQSILNGNTSFHAKQMATPYESKQIKKKDFIFPVHLSMTFYRSCENKFKC